MSKNYHDNLNLNNLPKEQWKDIKGFEGLYQISSYGRVKSLYKEVPNPKNKNKVFVYPEKIIKCQLDGCGYIRTQIFKNGKSTTIKVHREVAKAFLENPNNLPQVNHKDEDKTNNTLENLEWCTPEYNINYGTAKERIVESQRKLGFPGAKAGAKASSKRVLCVTTNMEFESASKAARHYKIDSSGVAKCCRGVFSYCGKLSDGTKLEWKYIE